MTFNGLMLSLLSVVSRLLIPTTINPRQNSLTLGSPGFPALLGLESAYRFEGCHLDQTTGKSTPIKSWLTALSVLKQINTCVSNWSANGYSKAVQFTPDNITQKWQDFIVDIAVPAFYRWCNLSALRQSLLLQKQYLTHTFEKAQSKLKIIKPENEAVLLSTTR